MGGRRFKAARGGGGRTGSEGLRHGGAVRCGEGVRQGEPPTRGGLREVGRCAPRSAAPSQENWAEASASGSFRRHCAIQNNRRGAGRREAGGPPAHSSLTPLPLPGRARRSPRAPRPLGAPKVVLAALPHAIPGSRRGGIRVVSPCAEWGAARARAGGADGYPERGPPPGSPFAEPAG